MNEQVATTTASVIANAFIQVLIFLSEIVFQWIPAALSVIVGAPGDESVPPEPEPAGPDIIETVGSVWDTLVPILIFISLLLVAAIIYATIRFVQVQRAQAAALEQTYETPPAEDIPLLTPEQRRWQRILEQAASENENDWRLAILEADIMLDEMLEARGYIGEGVGERLKRVDPADFKTLDMAWEAHKVRNNLAHRGSTHDLNNRETQRVIKLYENVFREFRLI